MGLAPSQSQTVPPARSVTSIRGSTCASCSVSALCRFAAAAQTARTSASRLTANSSVPLGSQQTAASHAAYACAATSCVSSSRPAALCGNTRSRSGTSTCDSSQSISATPIRRHADVARVGVAVDDAPLSSGEPRPRCSASNDTLRRHRAEVDLRPGFRMQEIGRRSPARALGPAVRQSVQLAECVGDATPVGLRFGRSALHVGHYDQTVGKVPAIGGRDRHRHRHPFTVEVSQQPGLPREVGVAAPAEPTDGELPIDAHAPHLVDANSASERFETGDVVTPLIECLPSHGRIFAEGHEALTAAQRVTAPVHVCWKERPLS